MPKNKPASQKASAGQKKRATKGAKTAPRKTGGGRKATKKKAAAKQTQVRKPKRPQVVPTVPQALQAPPEAKADALKSEGASMQERLQSMIKEHEAHAEKLRARITKDISSNKELQSINEELEATAEELQASNEELILLNEELRSSNAELNNRNVELEQLASDLSHLIAGVQIPIVVVGNDMRVRRFTPAAQKLLNLIPTDVGRPIGHIKPNIAIQDFESLISDVVDNWQTVEREIRDDAGHWHLLRIRPYRTAKNKVEGALIALMDIDTAKRAAEAIVETIRESLVVLDSQCRVTTANPAFYQTFGVSPREVENRSFFELQDGLWNVPELRLALEEMLPQNRQLENFELHLHEAQDTTRIMLLNARQLYKEGVGTGTILVAIQDITERKRAEEKLRQSEERYRALVNETPVAILVRTRKKIVFANPACAELFGVKSPDELIGRNPIDFVHPDHRSLARERMQRMDDKAAPAQAIERQAVRVDGRIVDVEVLATPILYNGRRSSHVLMLDTTAKKEAERKLRQLSQVFMDAADPIVIRDLEGRIIDLNAAAERAYGWRREQLIGRSIKTLVPRELHAQVDELIERCKQGEVVRNIEFERRDKKGRRIPILLTLSVLRDEAGRPVAVATMARHIEELKKAREALERNEAQLRNLAASLLTAQEDERSRIARELHDGLNQSLAMLVHDVEALEEEVPASAKRLARELERLREYTETLADEARRIAYELHPSALEHVGLVPALKSYCAELEEREGLAIRFAQRRVPESIPLEVARCLYRVSQECLHNILRHSGVKEASLTLAGNADEIRLSIRDRGAGFDTEAVERDHGLGLIGVRERVRLVGGSVSFESAPGTGTKVEVRVPLRKKPRRMAAKKS